MQLTAREREGGRNGQYSPRIDSATVPLRRWVLDVDEDDFFVIEGVLLDYSEALAAVRLGAAMTGEAAGKINRIRGFVERHFRK